MCLLVCECVCVVLGLRRVAIYTTCLMNCMPSQFLQQRADRLGRVGGGADGGGGREEGERK